MQTNEWLFIGTWKGIISSLEWLLRTETTPKQNFGIELHLPTPIVQRTAAHREEGELRRETVARALALVVAQAVAAVLQAGDIEHDCVHRFARRLLLRRPAQEDETILSRRLLLLHVGCRVACGEPAL